jgi:hypothetical protein
MRGKAGAASCAAVETVNRPHASTAINKRLAGPKTRDELLEHTSIRVFFGKEAHISRLESTFYK